MKRKAGRRVTGKLGVEERTGSGEMTTERKGIVREMLKIVDGKSTKIVTSIPLFFSGRP
jgi:hypothetical protein